MFGYDFEKRHAWCRLGCLLGVLICFLIGSRGFAYAAEVMSLDAASAEVSQTIQIENMFPGDSVTKTFDLIATYQDEEVTLSYDITIGLPTSAGNEYQKQVSNVDLIWTLQELPNGKGAEIYFHADGKPENLTDQLEIQAICHDFNTEGDSVRHDGTIGELEKRPDFVFKGNRQNENEDFSEGDGNGGSGGNSSASGTSGNGGASGTVLPTTQGIEMETVNIETSETTSETATSQTDEKMPSASEKKDNTSTDAQETEARVTILPKQDGETDGAKQTDGTKTTTRWFCLCGCGCICCWLLLLCLIVLLLILWYEHRRWRAEKKRHEE